MDRDREAERPVVNVVGERVALGPLRRDLLPAYQRWSNDLAAADRLGSLPRPVTLEGQTAWYDDEATRITFTIYERAAWRAIGGCSLIEVDHRSGTATLVILIGEGNFLAAVTDSIEATLSADGNAWSGSYSATVADPDGNVLYVGGATVWATRITVQPLATPTAGTPAAQLD